MTASIRFLRRAQRDLEEIHRYLQRDVPAAADRTIDGILDAIERLADFPESGARPNDPTLRARDFRFVLAGRYIAFYKVTRAQVRIYRVLHQRRAWADLL